jgi:hypothetical protein
MVWKYPSGQVLALQGPLIVPLYLVWRVPFSGERIHLCNTPRPHIIHSSIHHSSTSKTKDSIKHAVFDGDTVQLCTGPGRL